MGECAQIEALLVRLGLERHLEAFRAHAIDDEAGALLSEAHLREMGIALGDRLKIIEALVARKVDRGRVTLGLTLDAGTTDAAGGEHRQVTVLYCDLVDSTAITRRLGAERYAALYGEYLRACVDVALDNGQRIDQLRGDGVAICFGLSETREDNADRAVRTAVDLATAIAGITVDGDERARCRIGVATGEVLVDASSPTRAFGDVMNLASRLQDLGEPCTIIVADTTHGILGEAFEFVDLGEHSLAGYDRPQHAWRLGRALPGVSRFEATRGRRLSPLRGRARNQQQLIERWRDARARRGRAVLIEGDAGFGKSRLARELIDHIADESDVVVLRYQCMLRRKNVAFHPLVEQMERDARIRPEQSAPQRMERLAALLRESGSSTSAESLAVLGTVLGMEPEGGGGDAAPAVGSLPSILADVLLGQMRQLSATKTVLVLFEDVHWADPSTGKLLSRLLPMIADLRVLAILTYRPHELDGSMRATLARLQGSTADGLVSVQCLQPLVPPDSYAIIKHVAGQVTISPRVLEFIARKADGVPLFIEEVTKYVVESGKLATIEELAGRAGQIPERMLPATIRDYLTARLDALGDAKRLAQIGSAVGRTFTARLVAEVMQHSPDLIAPDLERLVAAELVLPRNDGDDRAFTFTHALIQDIAYEGMLSADKRQAHDRIAHALERLMPEVARAQPDVLALHYTEADRPELAIDYWRRAGEAAINRSAMAEARFQFQRGVDLVSTLPASPRRDHMELDLLTDLGGVIYALEGSGDSSLGIIYERVLELASRHERVDSEFSAHLGLANFHYVGGDLVTAARHITPCIELADRSNDADQIVHAYRIAGELDFYLGELGRSIAHLRRSIENYDRTRHQQLLGVLGDDPGALAHMYLAIGLYFNGEVREAFERCAKGIELARTLGHKYTLGQAMFDASWLHAMARDVGQARIFAGLAIDCCSDTRNEDFRLYHGLATVIEGWARSWQGEETAGIAEMERGMEMIRDTDAGICLSCFLPWLAEVLGRAGRIEEGLVLISEAHSCATERFFDAERLRVEGELRAHTDPEAARTLFERAIDVARSRGMKSMELRAALALHDLVLRCDGTVDVNALFDHLRAWAMRERAQAEARRACSLLAA